MRKLILALLLVGGLSFAKDHVFFSVGINLGTPYHCPEKVIYVERPVVYRPYYPPVYYVPVEERIVIIHKHKHKHWKHWKEWE
jgi:hypothetical protein